MTKCHPPVITKIDDINTESDNKTNIATTTTEKTSKTSSKTLNISITPIIMSDYTKITFQPDLKKFFPHASAKEINTYIHDIILLFQRRAYDIAGCVPNIQVIFNKSKIPIKSFHDYIKLFSHKNNIMNDNNQINNIDDSNQNESSDSNKNSKKDSKIPIFYQHVNNRWDVGITRSTSNTFENMSFVNCVWTPDGGSHVHIVTNQILRALEETLVKKGITSSIHPNTIKNKLMIFVRSNIENPSFESQSKLSLSSKPSTFGSTCELPASYIKSIVEKSGMKILIFNIFFFHIIHHSIQIRLLYFNFSTLNFVFVLFC
jgi:DNA topoisomerase-2